MSIPRSPPFFRTENADLASSRAWAEPSLRAARKSESGVAGARASLLNNRLEKFLGVQGNSSGGTESFGRICMAMLISHGETHVRGQ